MRRSRTAIILLVLVFLILTAISCNSQETETIETSSSVESTRQESAVAQTTSKWNDPRGTNVISANDAHLYYGEFKVVQGLIVKTYNSGKACFLDFKYDYKNGFVGVIFASDFPSFPASPENYYLQKEVRITGQITEYEGHPQIIIKSTSQIEIAKDTL